MAAKKKTTRKKQEYLFEDRLREAVDEWQEMVDKKIALKKKQDKAKKDLAEDYEAALTKIRKAMREEGKDRQVVTLSSGKVKIIKFKTALQIVDEDKEDDFEDED